jgi:hypothetical protein
MAANLTSGSGQAYESPGTRVYFGGEGDIPVAR